MKKMSKFFHSAAFRIIFFLVGTAIVTGLISFVMINSGIDKHFKELINQKDRFLVKHISRDLEQFAMQEIVLLKKDPQLLVNKFMNKKRYSEFFPCRNNCPPDPTKDFPKNRKKSFLFRDHREERPEPPRPKRKIVESLVITDNFNNIYFSSLQNTAKDKFPVASDEIVIENEIKFRVYAGSVFNKGISAEHRDLMVKAKKGIGKGLGVSALLAFATALLLLFSMYIPLNRIKRSAEKLAEGHYGFRTELLLKDEFYDLNESLNTLSSKLEHSEAKRKQMISDTAHELRTPAAALGSRIELIEEGIYSFDNNNLQSLKKDVRRLNSLIDSLMFLTGADSGSVSADIQNRTLTNDIKSIYERFIPQAEALNKGLKIELPENKIKASYDIKLFDICFGNLISNGIKYSSSEILISVQNPKEHKTEIIISDDGEGVNPSELEKIFDRYYRTDDSRNSGTGGSGLGLAIVKEICGVFDWTVSAENSDNGGLIVRIII